MPAWRCWLLSAAIVALAACATGPTPQRQALTLEMPAQDPLCAAYTAAWVSHFKANVDSLNRTGHGLESLPTDLRQARDELHRAGVDARSCALPYCIVQPLANGRLDSYCGYRVPDPTGRELYRWVTYR